MAKQRAKCQLTHTPELLRQVPLGHVIGPTRMALLVSPCCSRRIRVPLDQGKSGWQMRWPLRRCARCKFVWRLEAKITKNGYILRVRFKAAWPRGSSRQNVAKKQPK